MTPEEYIKECLRTCPDKDRQHIPTDKLFHAALGMATEAGEVVDAFKKQFFYGEKLDTDHIIEEIGDLLWYVSIALDHLNLSYEEVMQRNINKLEKRHPKEDLDETKEVPRVVIGD